MPKRRLRTDFNKEIAIEEFGNKAEIEKIKSLSLNDLSLAELARQFKEIDRQSHILKGKIILSARSRFKSDREFGTWLSDNLSDLNQKQAHRLMCIAEFFDERSQRSMEGIGLSACYELAAPQHKEIANQVYEEIAGKNYPLAVIKEKLYKTQTINLNVNKEPDTKTESVKTLNKDVKELIDIIVNNVLVNLNSVDAVNVLKECIIAIEANAKLVNVNK